NAERGDNLVVLVVRLEISLDVRLLLVVRDANRIGSGCGGLERVRHSERDVLTVIANDIVLERRAALFADAFESQLRYRTEDLADVLATQDRAHARHLLSRGGVKLDHSAVGDRRLHWH